MQDLCIPTLCYSVSQQHNETPLLFPLRSPPQVYQKPLIVSKLCLLLFHIVALLFFFYLKYNTYINTEKALVSGVTGTKGIPDIKKFRIFEGLY